MLSPSAAQRIKCDQRLLQCCTCAYSVTCTSHAMGTQPRVLTLFLRIYCKSLKGAVSKQRDDQQRFEIQIQGQGFGGRSSAVVLPQYCDRQQSSSFCNHCTAAIWASGGWRGSAARNLSTMHWLHFDPVAGLQVPYQHARGCPAGAAIREPAVRRAVRIGHVRVPCPPSSRLELYGGRFLPVLLSSGALMSQGHGGCRSSASGGRTY